MGSLTAAGLALCGMGGPWPDAGPTFYWTGMALAGFGMGLVATSQQTIISLRVPAYAQGKVFSVTAIVSTVTGQSQVLWMDVLFQPGSTGWRAGVPFFVGTAVLIGVLAWFTLLRLLHPQAAWLEKTNAVLKILDDSASL